MPMLSQPPATAVWLGYGGLIPFVGLSVALWIAGPAWRGFCTTALLAYGAVIASFLGAIYWGFAMRNVAGQHIRLYLWGVVPGLVAWLALLANPVAGLWLIAGLLWVCYAVDRAAYARHELQHWLPLRLRLTAVASASCVAAAAVRMG